MTVHHIYAQIHQDVVQNIIVCDEYEMANWLTRASYGEEAFAIDCLQYPCKIGDNYHHGHFYHVDEDGTETLVEYVPTSEEQVFMLEAENKRLTQQITDTQLALCELYEQME